ncbi:MAG: hypothetical protein IMZ52_04875, partial [Actinobacteria bacterium]|nr:hypothetical protein [Actinomycetota bacterium]
YFSKLEKELLESPYFINLRFRNLIESKRGRIPIQKAVITNPSEEIKIKINKKGEIIARVKNTEIFNKIRKKKGGHIYFPFYNLPDKNNVIISRFIGKIGLEELAKTLIKSKKLLLELVKGEELNRLRNYVRYDETGHVWPYHLRRIYDEEKTSIINNAPNQQTLHEYRLLITDEKELFIVVAIMGVEYCLNMGRPDLSGYLKWLKEHNNDSPLDDKYERNADLMKNPDIFKD